MHNIEEGAPTEARARMNEHKRIFTLKEAQQLLLRLAAREQERGKDQPHRRIAETGERAAGREVPRQNQQGHSHDDADAHRQRTDDQRDDGREEYRDEVPLLGCGSPRREVEEQSGN